MFQAVANHRAVVVTPAMPFQGGPDLRNLALRPALAKLRDLFRFAFQPRFPHQLTGYPENV